MSVTAKEEACLKTIAVEATRLIKGKRSHKHADGSMVYRQECQTCRLLAAVDGYAKWKED